MILSVPKQELNGQFAMLPMDDVHFGSGSLQKLTAALEHYGVKRAVVITGKSLAKTNLINRIENAAGKRTVGVFSETSQHVPRETVIAAADFARSKNADAIISFGGGTPNDTAKGVTICIANGITEPEGLDSVRIKFEYPDKVEIPSLATDPLPMFAVPTTLSAGEFTFFVGVTDRSRQVKDLYLDKRITAKSVFLDPALTLETPERLWLGTGMRAVDHCIEAMCSSTHQPFTDALAYRALNMLVRYLRETKQDPADIAARGQCMVAAWMSVCGLASVALGLSHGIGHQLGARCNVPHGETSAVMMHNVMETSVPSISYMTDVTHSCLSEIESLRSSGHKLFYTIYAGPQVKIICDPKSTETIKEVIIDRTDIIDVIHAGLGGPPKIIYEDCLWMKKYYL